jgi:hypothetical protein
MPAKAGIQGVGDNKISKTWIPAFAGMTDFPRCETISEERGGSRAKNSAKGDEGEFGPP